MAPTSELPRLLEPGNGLEHVQLDHGLRSIPGVPGWWRSQGSSAFIDGALRSQSLLQLGLASYLLSPLQVFLGKFFFCLFLCETLGSLKISWPITGILTFG